MNCQFCEDYEWSKKHRPKTGRELYTKYYVCLYERTLRKGCGLASTYTHKRRPLNFCPFMRKLTREHWRTAQDRVAESYKDRFGKCIGEKCMAYENGRCKRLEREGAQ